MENFTLVILDHKHRTRRIRADTTTARTTPIATMTQVRCHRATFESSKMHSPSAGPASHIARKLKPSQGLIEEIDTTKRFSCNMKPSVGRLCRMTPSKLFTLCCLILVSITTLEGSHHNQQQFASYSSNTNQATQQANRNVTVLLDTTEQSSLGWTRYPDGGPSGQGRTPGWSEESFLNVDKDINWRSFVTCDVAYESVNNWLWTPYLERGDANRLYIEIKFTMRDCNLFPQMVRSCKETFALLYNEVDGPIQAPVGQSVGNVSFAHADEYKLVDAIAADEGRFTSNSDVVINTEVKSVPVSKRGVYFAFRDQGACLSLIAIKVYSLSCPKLTTNLARFNSTPVGSDPGGLVAVEGECVANSIQIEQPRMFCTLAGTWNTVTSGQCKCLAGFEPVQNHTKCQACPPGRYKPLAGDSPCLPCPDKSHSSQTGATECKCHEGYFRAPKDARSQACSQPPSGPAQNLTAIHVDSTSAILQWQPPRSSSTSGGGGGHQRDDLTYKLLCDSCDFTTIASSPQFFSNFSETKCVLSGLQPATSYRFMLYVANGVSLMAAMSNHHYAQQQPFSEITIQTSKVAVQTQSNTLSSQNGLQLLPIYNFRTFAGARGSDMVLAWDSQQQNSPAPGGLFQSADSLLDSTTGLPIDQQPSLYEIKFQPRHLPQSQEQLMLARRSPYPLFDQQQQQLSMAQQQQSMTTTIKALGVYTLQPRTEYAFQIRAKWGHSGQWTDWSEPIFATTTASTSTSNNNNNNYNYINTQPSLSSFPEPPNFPQAIPNEWPPQSPFLPPPGSQPQLQPPPQSSSSASSWLSSVALVLLCSLIISILVAITLVHYRDSMCLKSLSSSLSGGLMGSNVGSTYAGVYNGGTSSDLIAGVANGNPLSGNYGSNQATSGGNGGGNGAGLIYHNAPAIAGLHHHHHLHATLSAGSNGQLITGSNSTSRSSSGAGNVVQNFLAATLGQLAGHHHNNNNNNHQHLNHSHISAKTLDAASSQQHSKLFLGSNSQSNQLGGRDNTPNGGGLFDTQTNHQQQHQQHQRNHYHQMLGNVNHTLLFSNNQQQQTGPLIPGQYQQQPVPIVPSNNGAGHHHNLAQHLSNLQQQLANGNSPQPPQVADLFIGHQNHHQQQQQSKYSNSRMLSGQQQQYGLANLHDPQVHIYDDLEVVSQSNQMDCTGEMLKFGQQQQLSKQAANRHQQTAIYAASRELYEPTTKLVIGSNGQQQQQQQSLNLSHHHNQQQQQQARAKFYKERAEDEFHDDNDE